MIEFELPDLKGERISPKSMLGKVVLLDLWATWCEPCKVSMPFYAALAKQHEKEGFEVVAISVDVHQDEVERFVSAEELPFLVLRDPDGTIPQRIGVTTLPTMMLLGRDGRIAYLHPGFLPADKEKIAAEIERALAVSVETSTAAPGDAPK
jgi:peroxiredoxin